jgi:hypothetical protein
MQGRKLRIDWPTLKWMIFLTVLACAATWAIRGILVRAQRMAAADTSASMFASIASGSPAKAVLRLDSVNGKELKGTLKNKARQSTWRHLKEHRL